MKKLILLLYGSLSHFNISHQCGFNSIDVDLLLTWVPFLLNIFLWCWWYIIIGISYLMLHYDSHVTCVIHVDYLIFFWHLFHPYHLCLLYLNVWAMWLYPWAYFDMIRLDWKLPLNTIGLGFKTGFESATIIFFSCTSCSLFQLNIWGMYN